MLPLQRASNGAVTKAYNKKQKNFMGGVGWGARQHHPASTIEVAEAASSNLASLSRYPKCPNTLVIDCQAMPIQAMQCAMQAYTQAMYVLKRYYPEPRYVKC